MSSSDFVWYEFHTPDAASAEAFYRGVLGWGTQDGGMPDGRYTMVTVDDLPIGGILEKPAASFTAGSRPGWVGYIGVADVEAYAKGVREAGGTIHRAVEPIPGVGSFAVVADPQSAIFVLFQPAAAEQQPRRPAPGAPGSPAWHDLYAADGQAAFTFYSDMFGWTKADAMDMGPNGIYQIFASNGIPIGGMMTRMDPSQSPFWLFYFNVAEIGPAVERVRQHGGTITHGPAEVPGGLIIAHALDPEGGAFGLVAPK